MSDRSDRKPTLTEQRVATSEQTIAKKNSQILDLQDLIASQNEQICDLQELITEGSNSNG